MTEEAEPKKRKRAPRRDYAKQLDNLEVRVAFAIAVLEEAASEEKRVNAGSVHVSPLLSIAIKTLRGTP